MAQLNGSTNDPGHSTQYYAKAVLVGGQGVGKTSILAVQSGDYSRKKTMPTIGVDFVEVQVPLRSVPNSFMKLKCWDTAGQERFHSVAKTYYRNTDAAFVVYDVTDLESFVQLKKWVDELKKNVPEDELILVVIGNKTDLNNYRKVDKWAAQYYADSINAHYFETSAFYGAGIGEAFEYAADTLVSKGLASTNPEAKMLDSKKQKKSKCKC